MTDVFVSDVPGGDVIDDPRCPGAARLGLSRSEYLRRRLAQRMAPNVSEPVTVADLDRFAETFIN